jgi:K+:H+ antiporter
MPELLTLITQLVVIVFVARIVGWLFRRAHQPQVVGEMTAGILLGPSVLGAVWPTAFQTIFPQASLGYLNALSQLGVLLFMFLVGLEFDPRLLRGRGDTAVITSHASIILPFLLGALLAIELYPRLAPPGVHFTGFALFMGAAMSVTAFPVLARILVETRLLHTRVGMVALACAAVDDVTAWCILAAVIVVVRAGMDAPPIWFVLGGTAAYITLMWLVARPLIRRFFDWLSHPARLTQDVIAGILVFALASALATERIGIHALFGAFIAGAVIPRDELFVPELTRRLEDLTVVFLLPLFFAFTGLRTSLGLVRGDLLAVAGLVIITAIAGKLFGSALAARLTGMSGREALAVGTLMNTRGLMELVILNIGLDIGVLSPALYSIMVAMALITTMMTAPMLRLLRLRPAEAGTPAVLRSSAE